MNVKLVFVIVAWLNLTQESVLSAIVLRVSENIWVDLEKSNLTKLFLDVLIMMFVVKSYLMLKLKNIFLNALKFKRVMEMLPNNVINATKTLKLLVNF